MHSKENRSAASRLVTVPMMPTSSGDCANRARRSARAALFAFLAVTIFADNQVAGTVWLDTKDNLLLPRNYEGIIDAYFTSIHEMTLKPTKHLKALCVQGVIAVKTGIEGFIERVSQ